MMKKKLLLIAVALTLLLTGWGQAVSALAPVTVGTLAQ
jgi:hypothetical protein